MCLRYAIGWSTVAVVAEWQGPEAGLAVLKAVAPAAFRITGAPSIRPPRTAAVNRMSRAGHFSARRAAA